MDGTELNDDTVDMITWRRREGSLDIAGEWDAGPRSGPVIAGAVDGSPTEWEDRMPETGVGSMAQDEMGVDVS